MWHTNETDITLYDNWNISKTLKNEKKRCGSLLIKVNVITKIT